MRCGGEQMMATGEEMLAQNMAAFEAGQELPYSDESGVDDVEPVDQEAQAQDRADDLPSEIDEIAERDGYMSREEWEASGKDPEDYMTKEEFARVAELRDDKGSNSRQKLAKQLVQQERLLRDMMASQQKMIRDAEERARNEAIAKLKAEQAEAVEYGDANKAIEIERKIADQTRKPEADSGQQINPSVQRFYNENSDWYNVDTGATGLLNVELTRAQRNGIDFDAAIGPAMAKVKRQFGYLFDDAPAKPEKSNVEPLVRPRATSERSAKPAQPQKKTKSFNDLPEEQRAFAKRMAKLSNMTESEYMEQM